MNWPLRSVLGEAWRSRHRLLAWSGLPFLLLLTGLVVAEVVAGNHLWEAEQRRQLSGGDVLTVAYDPPLASASRCLRLARWPSIEHVGAVGTPTAGSRAGFSIHPDAQAEVLEVTPGALPIIGAGKQVEVDGLVAGRQLADELGLAAGDQLLLRGSPSPVRVSGIIDSSVRFPGQGRVLYRVQAQPSRVQKCLIEAVPHARPEVRSALTAVGMATGNGAEVKPLGGGDLEDAWAAYRNRPAAHGWLIVSVLTGLSALAASWFGRASIGLYRALGLSRSDLVLMAGVQATLFVAPVMILAACGSWLVAANLTAVERPVALWREIGRNLALASLATLVAVPLAVLAIAKRSLFDLIRTRL